MQTRSIYSRACSRSTRDADRRVRRLRTTRTFKKRLKLVVRRTKTKPCCWNNRGGGDISWPLKTSRKLPSATALRRISNGNNRSSCSRQSRKLFRKSPLARAHKTKANVFVIFVTRAMPSPRSSVPLKLPLSKRIRKITATGRKSSKNSSKTKSNAARGRNKNGSTAPTVTETSSTSGF